MLRELRVRNYAIIGDLTFSPGGGLNVLSGETGAGKSILVGALGLVLGDRAYTEMIRTGAEEAVVEALFEIEGHPMLGALGIAGERGEGGGGLILRRIVSQGGKSRAYVNGSMVTLQALKALGDSLVDIHGQHDHQSLLNPNEQLRLLDAHGGCGPMLGRVAEAHAAYREIAARLDAVRGGARDAAQRADTLRYQIGEIEGSGLVPGEDAQLQRELEVLKNLTRLSELLGAAYEAVYSGEGAATERLSGAMDDLDEMASYDPDAAPMAAALREALPLIEDAALSMRALRDKYDTEPGRLDFVQDRMRVIDNLKSRYGGSADEVLEYLGRAREELGRLEHRAESTEELEAGLNVARAALEAEAGALTARRRDAARGLAVSVVKVLKGLALEKARFEILIEEAPEVTAQGGDAARFMFTANAGEDLKPLARVASGGELSRVMLALKGVLNQAGGVPVMIFDEVDAGIGGRTALDVAERLRALAIERQVLSITHLPQIAARADRHFVIEKGDRGGATRVTVRELQGDARVEELARMLGGEVTETSLGHAREMLAH